MEFVIDLKTVGVAQGNMPRFRTVPTRNDHPIVHIRGRLTVSHVDLSTDNICEYGQLPDQIRIYEEALAQAEQRLSCRETETKRKRVAAYATLLDTFEPDSPAWLFDDELEDLGFFEQIMREAGQEIPDGLREEINKLSLAATLIKADLPPHMIPAFVEFMKNRGLVGEQLTGELVSQYQKWYELSSDLVVLDAMPELLQTVLDALRREVVNRENAAKVNDLSDQLQQLERAHRQELRAAEVEGAVKVIQCLKISVAEKREAAIRAAFPDLAEEIIAALNAPEVTEADSGGNDWLGEFADEGEHVPVS